MVEFEDELGIVFWPERQIAALTPEFRGRWRGVLADGSVAHRPTPPPAGPWVRLGESLVLPGLLQRVSEGWRDPAGFAYPDFPPPPPGDPPQDLPEVPGAATSAPIPELGCRPEEVLGLRAAGVGRCVWSTDGGEVAWAMNTAQAARFHPSLVMARKGHFFNRTRLRRLGREANCFTVVLDNGETFAVMTAGGARGLARRLGLGRPDYLEPCIPGLLSQRLRDYPQELATAPGARLREWFGDARQLIANLLFQAVRYRQMGIVREYGATHRGFWYVPIYPTLYRAGFVDEPEVRWVGEDERGGGDAMCSLYLRVIDQLIGDDRLFTYRELGFDDLRQRHLGDRRPEVVLLVEKESLQGYASRLASEFGITYLITGGNPKLVATEYLADDLRPLVTGSLRVVAFVDYDPSGWSLADAFADQLRRYGMRVDGPVEHLVRAECFTAEELALYAMPCSVSGPGKEKLTRSWVKRSGGVGGKALGIHANHLQPVERVREELLKLL